MLDASNMESTWSVDFGRMSCCVVFFYKLWNVGQGQYCSWPNHMVKVLFIKHYFWLQTRTTTTIYSFRIELSQKYGMILWNVIAIFLDGQKSPSQIIDWNSTNMSLDGQMMRNPPYTPMPPLHISYYYSEDYIMYWYLTIFIRWLFFNIPHNHFNPSFIIIWCFICICNIILRG